MATTSFFYGGAPGPDQTTVNELVAQVEQAVSDAQAAQNSAQSSSNSAGSFADAAAQSASAASGSASAAQTAQSEAEGASATAVLQVAEAEDLLDQANAIISSFTISTASPSGGEEGDVWFKVSI